MAEWHSLPAEEVLEKLAVDPVKGLSSAEAEQRLARYGRNVLEEGKKRTILDSLVDQFKNVLVIILIFAALISYALGETVDALAIVAILILMAVMGVVQEHRAEKALEALKKLAAPTARVLRDGAPREIPAEDVVPGDILVLEEGDRIPADARLVEAVDLYVDESMLTGESVPVHKDPSAVLDASAPLAERVNMVFMGTHIVRGRGKAVVVATGMDTVMGRIAGMLGEAEEEKTPLQRDLDVLGRKIGIIVLVVAAVLFATGYILHEAPLVELFMASVALAVAAVPEGLPAIVTVVLAVNVWKMAKRNAIVRRLAAVEGLGAATVICTDKTGTLTRNEMTVRELWLPLNLRITVTGSGYSPEGELLADGARLRANERRQLDLLLLSATLANNASLVTENGDRKVLGDPLEAALLVLAEKAGLDPESVRTRYERIRELAFTSARKMMSTVNMVDSRLMLFSKGAPEVLLERSTRVMLEDGRIVELDDEVKGRILEVVEEMASRALRVLGFAYRELGDGWEDEDDPERNLVFLGLAGLMDPPRPEVPEAVRRAHEAGIRVVMVTGDHKATAIAVAKEVGIPVEGRYAVVTGKELDEMSDDQLYEIIEEVRVFARVTPEHKARIVKAYKKRGHVVAMTGDGVNDASALKLADIGIAMGKRGTDVAKEAADIILADDNFATIVAAVEEGRVAFDNIRKAVLYLLSANFAEVISVFTAGIVRWGLLFTPAMLLWINLVTDAFPAAAMAVEPPEPDVMRRPPRRVGKGIMDRRALLYLLYIGVAISILVLGSYIAGRFGMNAGHVYASSLAFTAMMAAELFHSFNVRSLNHSILRIGLTSNTKHLLSIVVGFAMALVSIYLAPWVFGATSISLEHLAVIVAASAAIILVEEARKRLGYRI